MPAHFHKIRTITLCIILLSSINGIGLSYNKVSAQMDCNNQSIHSVVHITPRVYDNNGNFQNRAGGSGVIIHPSGIILTAYHIISSTMNITSTQNFVRFLIGMSNDSQQISQPYYQAELLAFSESQDLALLHITRNLDGQLITSKQLGTLEFLPVMPIDAGDIFTRVKNAQIIGYPDSRYYKIDCKNYEIQSISQKDATIQLNGTLGSGYSGGPAIIKDGNQLKIIGIVRSNLHQRTILRSFHPNELMHWVDSRNPFYLTSAWIDGNSVKIKAISEEDATISIRFVFDLYTINLVGQKPQLFAYLFNKKTHEPIETNNQALQVPNKQLVLPIEPTSIPQFLVDKLVIDHSVKIRKEDLISNSTFNDFYFSLLIWQPDKRETLWAGRNEFGINSVVSPTPSTLVPSTLVPSTLVPSTLVPSTLVPSTSAPSTPAPSTPGLTPPPLILKGRIAYTRLNPRTGHIDTYIHCLETSGKCKELPNMRQPDINLGGYLVANGEGPELNDLIRMNYSYGNERLISRHPEDSHPHWSPDTRSLTFDSTFQGDGDSRIYWQANADIRPPEETKPLEYSGKDIRGRYPVFLSNGLIAYQGCDWWSKENPNSKCGIYAVVTGRGDVMPRRMTDRTNDIPTDNLNDKVVFMSDRDSKWDVYLGENPDNVSKLTSTGCNGLPTVSPDNKHIAFLSDRDGGLAIYIMDVDGKNQYQLAKVDTGYRCGDTVWTQERMSWGP